MDTSEIERVKPAHVPVHRLPAWLSSEDVLAAIRGLAEQGTDKAACWDMTQAVYALVKEAHGQAFMAEKGSLKP